ncbi:MAG: hypothetical protein IPP64_07700 [Bacteroidetes bacterium]|nr:hypothetical protein [Bacteroidota bacterium]
MKTKNQIQKINEQTTDSFKAIKISTENLLLFLNLNQLEKYSKQTFELYSSVMGIKKWSLLLLLALLSFGTFAQESKTKTKPSITVLNIDTKGLNLDPNQMGNMVRIELEKLDTFEVMDRYDVSYVVEKNKLNINNCYGKICLLEVGSIINSEKMFTGSVELIGEIVVANFRLIDVKTGTIEKTQVDEYLNLPKELQSMVKISIRKMFKKEVDEPLVTYLTKKNSFESSTSNPNQTSVNLSGPRSGFAYFTGDAGARLQAPRSEGGYGSYPLMFQFGYQFEVQYLNEGNYQALFEFLPTITGFNQNVFIPSLTIMNGFRNNKRGWELAFGPTFGLVNKANGYYDTERMWHLESEWTDTTMVNPYRIEKRIDSRGGYELQAGFIVAVGKTFKSGKLNIPVNIYVVPNKDGIRMGASFGFNAKRR